MTLLSVSFIAYNWLLLISHIQYEGTDYQEYYHQGSLSQYYTKNQRILKTNREKKNQDNFEE